MACPNEECPEFATPYSANQSDYFWANPGDVVVCIECETPMELVNAGYQVEFLGQRKTAGMKVLCLTCGTEFFTRNQFKMACPNCGEENNLANPALMSGEAVPEKTFEQWLRGATRKTAYDPEVAELGDMFQRQIENMPPPEDRAAFLPCPEHGDESEKGGTYASFPSAYTEYHCPQGHTFAVRPGTTREEMQSTGRKTASQFTIDGRGFVTGIASEDNTCLICGEAVDKGQEAYVSEWIEGEPQYTVHPLCGKPLLTAVHKKTSNKFLVYGGDAYGVPTIADSEPGVDLFDNLDEAMAEFRHRVEYGRTSQGLSTPLWNSDGTGGVIEVSDDDSETLDIHTATRKTSAFELVKLLFMPDAIAPYGEELIGTFDTEAEAEAERVRLEQGPGTNYFVRESSKTAEARKTALTDSRGMEVAFTPDGQPFYPTPCCGSFAKGSIDSETGVVCRSCYQEVDEIYGAVPDVPWRTGKTAGR